MVFLCHYRNKLIFGFKSEGGDSADSGRNMSQETEAEGWHIDKPTQPGECLCTGAERWISQLMFTMQDMRLQDNTPVGCVRGRAE